MTGKQTDRQTRTQTDRHKSDLMLRADCEMITTDGGANYARENKKKSCIACARKVVSTHLETSKKGSRKKKIVKKKKATRKTLSQNAEFS